MQDTDTVSTTSSSTLTATVNQTVAGTSHYIAIYDTDSGTVVALCGSGVSCATAVQVHVAGTRHFKAFVGGYSGLFPPTDVQAASDPLTVTLQPFTINVTTQTGNGNGSVLVTATVNQTVAGTNYYIAIYDADNNTLLAACGSSASCSGTSASVGHSFIAFVTSYPSGRAPPPDIAAAGAPPAATCPRSLYSRRTQRGLSDRRVGRRHHHMAANARRLPRPSVRPCVAALQRDTRERRAPSSRGR